MAKFRFYITDTMEGRIVGTDDVLKARHRALSEDYFVVDTESGEQFLPDGTEMEIEDIGDTDDDSDEDSDEDSDDDQDNEDK